MKLQQNFTVEIEDIDMLELINEEQELLSLECFDSLDEIPEQLIFLYLNESPTFADIFYDEYVYDVDEITIVK